MNILTKNERIVVSTDHIRYTTDNTKGNKNHLIEYKM